MTGVANKLTYLKRSDLIKGDVVLALGSRPIISDAIRLIDGGDYSHGAFYDGESIIEADFEGVVATPIEEMVEKERYVDVYRFKSDTGESLLSKTWPPSPLIKKAHCYLDNGTKYAFNHLVLAGILIFARKRPTSQLGKDTLRFVIDELYNYYKKIKGVKEPKMVVCSELVYRIFYEAESVPEHKYGLAIKDTLHPVEFTNESFVEAEKLFKEESDEEVIRLNKKLEELEELFWQVHPHISHLKQKNNNLLEGGSPFVAPELVSPRDLQYSPNLVKLGRLAK